MRYLSNIRISSSSESLQHPYKRGVLLLNLGGPDSLKAVRPFLYNLFSDREIIRLGPPFMQRPLAWLVSFFRSSKTRGMYSLIGGKSPIVDITMAQAEGLQEALNQNTDNPSSLSFKVYIGMRYWHPFIKDTVRKILSDGVKHLVVLSLYPHYSRATTGSAIAEFKRAISQLPGSASRPSVKYIEHWYDFPPYIDALAELIYKGISGFSKDVDILYSAHNLPETLIREGDPYLDHIKGTIRGLHERLSSAPYNIQALRWHLSFQSKSGPVRWLRPSTDETIVRLAREGIRNLFVVPISFVSDHIETLYEIDIIYKELAQGQGINLKRCEALNTSEKFIKALKELVMQK